MGVCQMRRWLPLLVAAVLLLAAGCATVGEKDEEGRRDQPSRGRLFDPGDADDDR